MFLVYDYRYNNLLVKNILTHYPKEVSFLKRVKDDSLAVGGR
ncbi:hypothetical protein [Bacillus cereus]